MSELRSAIDGLRGETLTELPDARIEEDFAEIRRTVEQLELEGMRRLAEIERRRLFERGGHLSAAGWLTAAHRMSWGLARDQVRTARALETMHETRAASDDGAISLSAARALVAAHDADPEAFAAAEERLVDAAKIHSLGDLGRVIAYWRQAVERERVEDDATVRERRRLHASLTFQGMVRLDGDLDPETGETLLTALRAVVDADVRRGVADDARTPAQRRADALGEICRHWLDRSDRPTVAGERPHVTLTVAADVLSAADVMRAAEAPSVTAGAIGMLPGPTTMCELDHAGPVPAEMARRLACDASVMRVVLSGRSEPLDVGRRTPVVPPAIRRAVVLRDRRCRFPGCDRPHTWCDAHHVTHWADGGPTSLANLILLCRRHHRAIHERGGVSLAMSAEGPEFRGADGTRLDDRAPP
ncbi:MAG TPA: DUF222 domain-containing protein [Actinomycetota bacterium]|jgi:hypothetical protein